MSSVSHNWVGHHNGRVVFEFNDISLNTIKYDSERKQSAYISTDIWYTIQYSLFIRFILGTCRVRISSLPE